ncbi:ABC transporter permease [Haliovirga abyssi]|uniref:ABC transporter permease n=1 Tax=Haliovirga abyssi TaxID=2996794 RepID=A0AAU9DCR6_9FUSO|nr:FtsX-like permease family protein [Haliovirga abyssi]BDU50087.1 ABC transporter permease [Haliovirga abyssi]
MLVKLAFRNIFRKKTRTILTLTVLIFGVYLAIFYDGILKGYTREMINTYINTDIGEFKIYKKGYYKNKDDDERLKYLIDKKEVEKDLDKLNIDRYSSRLLFDGTIAIDENELPIKILGINPKVENKIFKRDKATVSGNFLSGNKGIVIGIGLAKALKLKVGDIVTILARGVEKTINADDLKIVGIIETKNNILDESSCFINLNYAQNFVNTKKINDIVIMNKLNRKDIKILGKNYDVISWKKDLGNLIELMEFKAKASNQVVFLILIMAGVGIASTMLMSMLERKKEIGIMLADGMKRKNILLLFLIEGGFIGVIGSFIGAVLGVITNYFLHIYGIPLPIETYKKMQLNMVIPEKMHADLDMKTVLLFFLLGILIALISSFYTAYEASKSNPVEALKNM